ncbi:MAG TPA: hypothetical protein VLA34_11905, partial [Candidatus Krumholzibacterium sp.]|nr:hypothetical protein [Candidatus Krumholzibacterium sp.]
ESTDDLGVSTLCIIEVNVISVAMEYPLLWIDDFPSSDFTQETFAFPTETEHDDFWTDICMLVPGFLPARDTYDVAEHGFRPPPLEVVFKYKNIIWTYSSAVDPEGGSIWTRMINYPFQTIFNFIPDYMAYGGHIWTCGSSERTGGMGAVLTMFRIYPSNLECDLLNSSPGCGVPVGMSTMPYKDFCVTVIDKVNAPFKDWIPFRRVLEYDAMSYAALDFNDDFTQQHPGLPQTLTLRDEVTSPGMFFDPDVRGFDRVEIYNPRYWMSFMRIMEQSCFHPMYLIRTRSYRSVLYNQPVAFWTTRHAGVIAPGDRNCAAPSVHFGLPLWYFDSGQVRDIARVIFEEWQILQ